MSALIGDWQDKFPAMRLRQLQQNLPEFDIAVLVLRARTNRLRDLVPLVPKVLDALSDPQRGKAVFVDS